MSFSRLDDLAFVLLLVTFLVGALVAKRGGNALAEADRATLTSWGPDPVAIALPIVMIGLGFYLAGRMPLISIAVAVVAFCLWIYRVPYRISKQSWPSAARLQLILGNVLLAIGCLLFVIIKAAQHV